jgi:hypothetical protein
MRAALALCAAGLLLAAAGPAARAHPVTPEQVEAGIAAPPMGSAFDVIAATRDARLARLLVVRVGPGWARVDASRRAQAAEAWRSLWREASPTGVLAIVDATGRSLVDFDAKGRARIRNGDGLK